jgi:DNA-binding transcriptional regulator YhcF (GntR family)
VSRPRSAQVEEVKAKLIHRIQHGFHRPGERFFSNRDLAKRFGVSYQTAHRLISELAAEGWLERRSASGTYIPGNHETISGVQLIFNERGQRAGSYGQRLLQQLTSRLDDERIPWRVSWAGSEVRLSRKLFPVIWETPSVLGVMDSRYALLLNDEPAAGIAASWVDSVSTDDYSGGVCAAELLLKWANPGSEFAVLAGPETDARSLRRVAGFKQLVGNARVCWAESWFFEDGRTTARDVIKGNPGAVFCCNDRLAEGLISYCELAQAPLPAIVGFDDAPVAEKLNFSTVAIPWREIADGAVTVIKKRLRGDTATASRQIFAPRPVVRKTLNFG